MLQLTRRQAGSLLASSIPLLGRVKDRPRRLRADIDREIAATDALTSGFVGIYAVRVSDGKVLYQREQQRLFVPASNTKLFTSAMALSRLGQDYRFTTSVLAEGHVDESGRLHGDLVLVGRGDPTLSDRVYPYSTDPSTLDPLQPIDELADQLIKGGLRSIDGDIVGDDSRYPLAPYPGAWNSGDETWDYGAPVSAIVINDNRTTLSITPGEADGDPAQVSFLPTIEYFEVENRIRTDSQSGRAIHIERREGSREVTLWGRIGISDAPVIERLAIPEPALFGATVLRDALLRRGVSVRGEATARHRQLADEALQAPAAVSELARRSSPPLIQILQVVDKVSQNLHAEILLREVGAVRRNSGTILAGLAEMQDFLTAAGISEDDVHLRDGSGLSRNALVTPQAIVGLLLFLYRSPLRDQFLNLLPVGGEDGSLRTRFTKHAEARNIHAKTGTLSGVHALSGFAQSKTNGLVAFSILINNVNGDSPQVTSFLDNIGLKLVR